MKNIKLALKNISTEELLNDNAKSYNESKWRLMVYRYVKYGATFYKVDKDDIHSYDRFYAVYNLPEGLKLFSSIGYSSMVHDGGFKAIHILDGEVVVSGFGDNGNSAASNTSRNRQILSVNSKKLGVVYTTEF